MQSNMGFENKVFKNYLKAEQKANIDELVKECITNAKQLTTKDVDSILNEKK